MIPTHVIYRADPVYLDKSLRTSAVRLGIA